MQIRQGGRGVGSTYVLRNVNQSVKTIGLHYVAQRKRTTLFVRWRDLTNIRRL